MAAHATKRRKLGPDQEFEEITGAEYEEDLTSTLARIKEQEDSEALARQLEAEWNNMPSTSANVSKSSEVVNGVERDIILIPDDDEDDEAMARRLAREWDEQDSRTWPSHSVPSTSSRMDTSGSRPSSGSLSPLVLDLPPDKKLHEYQSLFTQERGCPKCNKKVESPRGLVSRLRLYQQHRLIYLYIVQVIFSASVPPPTLLYVVLSLRTPPS
jgi:baculoviral IAP repeat-containing protein 6